VHRAINDDLRTLNFSSVCNGEQHTLPIGIRNVHDRLFSSSSIYSKSLFRFFRLKKLNTMEFATYTRRSSESEIERRAKLNLEPMTLMKVL